MAAREFPRHIRNPHCQICRLNWADVRVPVEKEELDAVGNHKIGSMMVCEPCYQNILSKIHRDNALRNKEGI